MRSARRRERSEMTITIRLVFALLGALGAVQAAHQTSFPDSYNSSSSRYLVWAAFVLLRRSDHSTGPVAGFGPSELLDRRLASGEIDAATYDALHSKLRPAQERQEPHAQ